MPRDRALPPGLADELRPIAERYGLTSQQTAAALIDIVTGRGTSQPAVQLVA